MRVLRAVLLPVLLLATAAQAQSPVTEPQRPGGPKLDVDFEATTPVVAKAMLDMAGVAASDIVMDLGCGEGDIALAGGKTYNFGFAIHDDHAAGRFHHVSLGYSLGIDAKADITAAKP